MTKNIRTGLSITIGCMISGALSSYDLFGEKKLPIPLTVTFMLLGIAGTFMGPAIMFFDLPLERRIKIARLSNRISALIMLAAILSGYNHIPGAGAEIIIGVLMFCFFHGTLSLKNV